MRYNRLFVSATLCALISIAVSCTGDDKPQYYFPSGGDGSSTVDPSGPGPGSDGQQPGEDNPGDGGSTNPMPGYEGKPCFIWVDAAANFPDFANSRENIIRDLKKAAECGFTDVVVDIRHTTGDVLFQTDKCDQVDWLGAWVSGEGYKQIYRDADWDYLQAFIDEGHKLGLRVYAGFNTMVGGHTSSRGHQGIVFRDNNMAQYATMLNTPTGIKSILDINTEGTKFFNPCHPKVQEYIIGLLEDLAKYEDLDGIILDRCRYHGFQSDFSEYTKKAFEGYIGKKITNWPGDVLPVGCTIYTYESNQTYTKQWHEFRAKVIHDFMRDARSAVKKVNPDMKFGAYVGAWYSTYYEYGVNWASPDYNPASYFPLWASANYSKFGYADMMDILIVGAYAKPGNVRGSSEWTMEGFCKLAKDKTKNQPGLLVGGPDVGNWDAEDKFTQQQENQAIMDSVVPCANACGGYFLFDMIHLKLADQWEFVKEGIKKLKQ